MTLHISSFDKWFNSLNFSIRIFLEKEKYFFIFLRHGDTVYKGGRAQSVQVLSAEVERKEKWRGCQRAEMTLSEWEATSTEGRGCVRSPWGEIISIIANISKNKLKFQ